MKVWVSTDFEGFYPVGTAAVVVAPDASSASRLLSLELERRGLKGDGFSVEAVPMDRLGARILRDGDY